MRVGAAIPSDPPAGDVPHGYTFLRHHRQGGFGSVIVVRDHRTAREVALKWLHSGLRHDAHCRELIEAEARLTASLQHPNIVPVYDIGENADGHFYYTMRLVPGLTLDEYLDLLTAERTSFPSDSDLRRLVDCLRKICDAVMYAHARGVLHLDLKPSNILVGDFGEVLLVDWGCAAKLTIGADQLQCLRDRRRMKNRVRAAFATARPPTWHLSSSTVQTAGSAPKRTSISLVACCMRFSRCPLQTSGGSRASPPRTSSDLAEGCLGRSRREGVRVRSVARCTQCRSARSRETLENATKVSRNLRRISTTGSQMNRCLRIASG